MYLTSLIEILRFEKSAENVNDQRLTVIRKRLFYFLYEYMFAHDVVALRQQILDNLKTKNEGPKTLNAFDHMRAVMSACSPIKDDTWSKLMAICRVISRCKGTELYEFGLLPNSYCFMHQGIARLYASDDQGQEYNKRFFVEGEFPGIMSALHLGHRVEQGIECLTDSILIEIDFVKYRDLLFSHDDLMQYQIHYLEKNWLLDKDKREILLVQKDATARYLHFLEQSPELTDRIPQYHLASHLGVSATQLSRIRKSLGKI